MLLENIAINWKCFCWCLMEDTGVCWCLMENADTFVGWSIVY